MARKKQAKPAVTADQMGDASLYEHDRVGQSVNYGMTLIFQVDQIRKAMTLDLTEVTLNGVRTLERMLNPYANDKFRDAKKLLDNDFANELDNIEEWTQLETLHNRQILLRSYTGKLFELCLGLMSDNGFLPEHGMVETI